MTSSQVWGEDLARRYDNDHSWMNTDDAIAPAVNFLERIAEGGRALEFAIGTGRIGVPLANRGVPVVGIELSQPMVDQLRTKADEHRIPVHVGDMATTRVAGEFTLVYLVFNTIGNLLTQSEQVECFRNASRHLAPGGRFVIELGVPPLRYLPPRAAGVPFDISPTHLGVDTFDLVTQRLTSHHYFPETGDYTGTEQRYVWSAELDLMAQIAGLEIERRVADWDGSEFTSDSEKHVSVWRKP